MNLFTDFEARIKNALEQLDLVLEELVNGLLDAVLEFTGTDDPEGLTGSQMDKRAGN